MSKYKQTLCLTFLFWVYFYFCSFLYRNFCTNFFIIRMKHCLVLQIAIFFFNGLVKEKKLPFFLWKFFILLLLPSQRASNNILPACLHFLSGIFCEPGELLECNQQRLYAVETGDTCRLFASADPADFYISGPYVCRPLPKMNGGCIDELSMVVLSK